MPSMGEYANIAAENRLLDRAALPKDVDRWLRAALDTACTMYDRAAYRRSKARQDWYRSEQHMAVEFASDMLRELSCLVSALTAAPAPSTPSDQP